MHGTGLVNFMIKLVWIVMTEYYFDIETYSPNQRPDPRVDKIITIQFQKIDLRTGKPKGELEILKEWESSEKDIVSKFFYRFFNDKNVWEFVAVGYNLNFEWELLIAKFKKYFNKDYNSFDIHYKRPHIDIQHIVVLLNNGSFSGAKLDKFTGKPHDGSLIPKWYEEKKYNDIVTYIEKEAESFLNLLQQIIIALNRFKNERNRNLNFK